MTLVDEYDHPVTGAKLYRQLDRYNGKLTTATFPLHGLHPTRPEFVRFLHPERSLVGYIAAARLGDGPFKVTMRGAATITGRLVDENGESARDFGVLITGDGELREEIEAGVRQRGLGDVVSMPGWLEDPVEALTD